MSLYGHTNLSDEYSGVDIDSVVESFFYDDISRMSSDQIKQFLESEQCKALVERSILNKPTLMRLSKEDDRLRRIRIMCYTIAKQTKDPNWEKCKKYRALWKKYRGIIFAKYGAKATRLATIAQNKYIKQAHAGQQQSDSNSNK